MSTTATHTKQEPPKPVSPKTVAATLAAVSGLALSSLAVLKLSRAGYESAPYETVVTKGAFEVRDYPDVPVVTTPMAGNDLNNSSSFRRLFRFISGHNVEGKKISMTTPVFSSTSERGGQMSFVVPSEVARGGTPEASDPNVEVGTMEGGRFAVYRFSGSWNPARFDEAKQTLVDWMDKVGLTPVAATLVAGYDPPFTPSFLKRNEVLIRIANPDSDFESSEGISQ